MVDDGPVDLEPTIFVIFGLTGDLAQRKLLPALYNLLAQNLLHEKTVIVGISRREVSVDEVIANLTKDDRPNDGSYDDAVLNKLRSLTKMYQMNLTEGQDYDKLHQFLDQIETEHGVCMNRLYYLSIPPQVFGPIVRLLGAHGLNASCQHGEAKTRLLIEKPFGFDVDSAKALIQETADYFREDQTFRIDHYVAKDSVQNILTFRFNNSLFNSVWNAKHICGIEVTANEQLDIEGRVAFYEETGALRDIIQSHLLLLLAILTMERPKEMSADGIQEALVNLLKDIPAVPADRIWENSARGQYNSYRQEVNNPDSRIETYAAIKLFINNDNWNGVPVLLRTGKALDKKLTEMRVFFRPTDEEPAPNILRFSIQPEAIELDLQAKQPGLEYKPQAISLTYNYQDQIQNTDAYERVLVDAVKGDRTRFATSDMVMEAWRIIEPVLKAWASTDENLETYTKGSAGPGSAVKLAEATEAQWYS